MINEIPRRSHTRSVGMTNNLLQGFRQPSPDSYRGFVTIEQGRNVHRWKK